MYSSFLYIRGSICKHILHTLFVVIFFFTASVLDCLERKELITPEESVSLAVGSPDRTWADSLVHVLQQKSVQVIDAARDALAPFQDTNSILMALKCTYVHTYMSVCMSSTLQGVWNNIWHNVFYVCHIILVCVETDAVRILDTPY